MFLRENNEIVRRYALSLLREDVSIVKQKIDTNKMDYIERVISSGNVSEKMLSIWRNVFAPADEQNEINGLTKVEKERPDILKQGNMSLVDIFETDLESAIEDNPDDDDFIDEAKNMLFTLERIGKQPVRI